MLTYATQQFDKPGMQEFQAFYEDNLVRVYRFVFKSLRNREEAEDLTSQIFLKALRYLDPERNAQSARSWLFKIAHTTIADYWRIHYRELIGRLFAAHGFAEYLTSEPNIRMDPANILVARLGSRLAEESMNRFFQRLLQSDTLPGL